MIDVYKKDLKGRKQIEETIMAEYGLKVGGLCAMMATMSVVGWLVGYTAGRINVYWLYTYNSKCVRQLFLLSKPLIQNYENI